MYNLKIINQSQVASLDIALDGLNLEIRIDYEYWLYSPFLF